MLGRLLGLMPVRAARLRVAAEQLRKSDARLTQLRDALEKARAGAEEWKTKADDAERRVSEVRADVARHVKQIERMQTQTARSEEEHAREVEQLRARVADLTEKRARDAADLREHLKMTARDLAVAREHLMTIDVKLDLVEGAATVLDNRTRAILGARKTQEPGVTS